MDSEKQQEIELKLQVTQPEAWPRIVEYIHNLPGRVKQEKIAMLARYYDTSDLRLNQSRMSYRLRRENDQLVATVKGGGSSDHGLHKRLEINRPALSLDPDLTLFYDVPEVATLFASVPVNELQVVTETEFSRETVRVEWNQMAIEVALDQGVIRAGEASTPILEVELELISGSEDDILALGEILCSKFPLAPEPRSKFFRGLVLSGLVVSRK